MLFCILHWTLAPTVLGGAVKLSKANVSSVRVMCLGPTTKIAMGLWQMGRALTPLANISFIMHS